MTMHLAVTRVVNACALITLDGETVLTDPYFDEHWFVRLRETIGVKAAELPKLSAIIGGHGVWDHWQPGSLVSYPFKATTPVFVATDAMQRKATAAGFKTIEVLPWHAQRRVSDRLAIEVVPAQTVTGLTANNYVVRGGDLKIFVGTEARDVAPLHRYRADHGPVDVALLPIDGSALAGRQLVMTAAEAVAGARALGAKVFIPIHFALKPVPVLLQIPNTISDVIAIQKHVADMDIVVLEPGARWVR